MANLVNAELVSKAYGDRPLLDQVSLGVQTGARIGVVGRNGAGKSTLLRVLAGSESPDSGRLSTTRGVRIGVVAQREDADPEATVRAVVLDDRLTHHWASDAAVREILDNLLGGHDDVRLDRRLGTLSGGERRRVELSRALISDLDLLILDEPTNHLDLEAVSWLAEHVRCRPDMALVVVTHDRWFLDAVTDRTWEVVGGAVEEYDGGYSAYVLAKAERMRQAQAENDRRANLIRKELAWLRRGAPARTSKPKFRVEAANELIATEPEPRDSASLLSFADARLGKTVFELHDLTVAVGDRTLLDHVTWNIGPGQRIGLLGANGAGKTSLLLTILGERPPARGRLVTGVTVRPAHLSQHLDELEPSWRVIEAVERVATHVDLGKGRSLSASQLCERLGFNHDGQWTPVADLSGGERRRLQLTRLLMSSPNVLVLDEPTNDFDVETLAALEDLLDDFVGTLIVVSHDRYFLERVCDDVYGLLGDEQVRHLPGGVEEYLDRRLSAVERSRAAVAAPARRTTSDAAADRERRKELQRLERAVERLSAREAVLHGQLADSATDYARVAELDRELRSTQAERSELEERWLEVASVSDHA